VNDRYDVLISGFGPVGQVAANVLGQRGFRAAVFDVATSIYNLPRAAHFDGEVMRVFQSIGLAEAVLPACAEVKGMHFLSANGETLLAFDAPDGPTSNGWPAGYLFYQPDLERALQDGVRRFPNVDVFPGHEVRGIENRDDGVALTVREIGSGEDKTFEGDWLWGCDGARSPTRKALGIELEDFGLDQPWLVVDTLLKRDCELPEIALQICDPARPSTYVPSCGRHRRWEFMLMAGESAEELEQPEVYWRILSRWITPDEAEVIRAVVYRFHALIAKDYRRGRAFILGDAAHQMPPFLGQGMCAGIRDVANLAWKLNAFRQGRAGEGLLSTYYEERAPHVRTIISRAVAVGQVIQATDPKAAEARDAAFLAAKNQHHKIGEPGAFDLRMPGLTGGVIDPQAASGSVAGQLVPQPTIEFQGKQRRLDDLLGGRWAIIALGDSSDMFTPEVTSAWDFAAPKVLHLGGEAGALLSRWLGARVAVVRPDLYIYGVADSTMELKGLAEQACRILSPAPPASESHSTWCTSARNPPGAAR
jgi:3-(3-hydroxy-phenyl)propionate hydroxylase